MITCLPGTPAAKIKGLRNTIKDTTLHKVNHNQISSLDAIQNHIDRTTPTTLFQFKTPFQPTLHPETGTTQITFDRFVSIAKHHQDIRKDKEPPVIIDADNVDPIPTCYQYCNYPQRLSVGVSLSKSRRKLRSYHYSNTSNTNQPYIHHYL